MDTQLVLIALLTTLAILVVSAVVIKIRLGRHIRELEEEIARRDEENAHTYSKGAIRIINNDK